MQLGHNELRSPAGPKASPWLRSSPRPIRIGFGFSCSTAGRREACAHPIIRGSKESDASERSQSRELPGSRTKSVISRRSLAPIAGRERGGDTSAGNLFPSCLEPRCRRGVRSHEHAHRRPRGTRCNPYQRLSSIASRTGGLTSREAGTSPGDSGSDTLSSCPGRANPIGGRDRPDPR